jgi:predicted amidophosphoribosyltransferase
MAVVKTDPSRLPGPWADGYAVERHHTLSSEFIGHDSFGNPQFDSKRSELGELIFRLKNRNDRNTHDSIADTAVEFLKGWGIAFDLIVPMPPSRKRAAYQPVPEIAAAIGARMSVPLVGAVSKIKDTPQLKDIYDYQERIKLLQDAFESDPEVVRGRRILLIDDLYRSGATANLVTQSLLSAAAADTNMTKVFIAGSRKLSRFNAEVKRRIDNMIEKGFTILVGDANGADKAAQKYLSDKHYKNVVVYCMVGHCRNNVGRWPAHEVTAPNGVRGFAYYSLKDQAMVDEATYALMLWDGESKGTLNNVINLLRQNKPVVVYLAPKKTFQNLRSSADLQELLGKCNRASVQRFEQELGIGQSLYQ